LNKYRENQEVAEPNRVLPGQVWEDNGRFYITTGTNGPEGDWHCVAFLEYDEKMWWAADDMTAEDDFILTMNYCGLFHPLPSDK